MQWAKSSKFARIPYAERLDIIQSSQAFSCPIEGNHIASILIR